MIFFLQPCWMLTIDKVNTANVLFTLSKSHAFAALGSFFSPSRHNMAKGYCYRRVLMSLCPSVPLLTFSCVHQNSETVHWIHLKFGIQMQNNM